MEPFPLRRKFYNVNFRSTSLRTTCCLFENSSSRKVELSQRQIAKGGRHIPKLFTDGRWLLRFFLGINHDLPTCSHFDNDCRNGGCKLKLLFSV